MEPLTEGRDYAVIEPDEQLESEALAYLLKVWNDARGDRDIPSLADIDLSAHVAQAKFWAIVDILPEDDIRIRFLGTEYVAFIAFEPGQATLNDVVARYGQTSFIERSKVLLERSIETRKPVWRFKGPATARDRGHYDLESLTVPLGPEGGPVTQIMAVVSVNLRKTSD